jgi:hypothetical protein
MEKKSYPRVQKIVQNPHTGTLPCPEVRHKKSFNANRRLAGFMVLLKY